MECVISLISLCGGHLLFPYRCNAVSGDQSMHMYMYLAWVVRDCAVERMDFMNHRIALAQIIGTSACSVAEMIVQFVFQRCAFPTQFPHRSHTIPIPFLDQSQTIPIPFPDHSQTIPDCSLTILMQFWDHSLSQSLYDFSMAINCKPCPSPRNGRAWKEITVLWFCYRLPKEEGDTTQGGSGGRIKPLYDIPYVFEAREFLRKKLIGKKVWLPS